MRGEEHRMSQTASSPRWRIVGRRGLIIGLALAIAIALASAGYTAFRYVTDRANYEQGMEHYQRGECAAAINRFDSILSGWRLIDIGGYANLAGQRRAECVPFQAIVDKHESGIYRTALVEYIDFVQNPSSSILADAARQRIASLFEQVAPVQLASQQSCERVDILRSQNLIPQPDVYAPSFYFACGQVYDILYDWERSYKLYQTILTRHSQHAVAPDAERALLDNPAACMQHSALQNTIIAARPDFMPALSYRCGWMYAKLEDWENAFRMHEYVLKNYPNHSLASSAAHALLDNPVACEQHSALQKTTIADRPDFMPALSHRCGRMYAEQKDWEKAFQMHEYMLKNHPNHQLAADAERALLDNPVACERHGLLRNTTLAGRPDLMPTLSYRCGQIYERKKDWANAIRMYEYVLNNYPNHALALDAEAALARSILERAKAEGAGEIAAPEPSGRTNKDIVEVVVQNDSPARLRIVFSGPETRVEELEACASCQIYSVTGPLYCPEKGPVGRYRLAPGTYDIVVEVIETTDSSRNEVTPWRGAWTLKGGNEYYSCFFIRTTLTP